MKNWLAPVVFVASTTALLITAASSTIVVPPSPAPPVPGVDVSLVAVGSTPNAIARAFNIFNPTGSAGVSGSATVPGPVGFVGIVFGTTSCNVQPVDAPAFGGPALYNGSPNPFLDPDWYAEWDSGGPSGGHASGDRHPYIASSTYRTLPNGRLEQLSAAWVKHGWFAASSQMVTVGDPVNGTGQMGCGGVNNSGRTATNGNPCNSAIQDNQLGANCADTYSQAHNNNRYDIGPRNEIKARNPTSNPGYYQSGGYHDNMSSADPVDVNAATPNNNTRSYLVSSPAQMYKLNMVALTELSEASAASGGKIIFEGYYVVNGDGNKLNNIAHREFNYTPPTSGFPTFTGTNFAFSGPHRFGPALFRWAGADVQQALPADLGQAYVGARVTFSAVTGLYTYEYNVLNVDTDTGLWSVDIPIRATTNPTDVGFHQPRQTSPAFPSTNVNSVGGFMWGYDAAAWSSQTQAAALRFEPPAAALPNNFKNAVRWGTMYTYWFSSAQPPRQGAVMTIARSSDGSIPPMTVTIPAPRSLADITDIGGGGPPDGELTVDDIIAFFNTFADSTGCPGPAPCSPADVTGVGGPPETPDGQLTVDDVIAFINAFSDG